ncbi:MAG: serine O-acetyltransferase [Clostridia bacterium]|nr:serine O-acetyltransferase [Clostridia bacterium]
MFYTLKSIQKRDPAAKSKLGIFFLYSGYHALMWHRTASFFYRIKLKGIAKFLSNCCKFFTGVEIHPGAKIGKGLFIDHGVGVVIGETAIIGNDVTIYQGVTLGGTGKETGKRHPTVGDNVLIGAGAKVLGNITIGSNSKIAANAVVLHDIPENCTAVGVPAVVVKKNGLKIDKENPCDKKDTKEQYPDYDMDQVHIPDPTHTELERLAQQLCILQKKVYDLQQQHKEHNEQ